MNQTPRSAPSECEAAVFVAPGARLETRRLRVAQPAAGEILVRTRLCTLCGSDLHTFDGRRQGPTPTVLGHEILGEIAELGGDAPMRDQQGCELAVGDRVTWSITASCGECFYCRQQLLQKCDQLFKYGHESLSRSPALSGGLAQYCHLVRGTAVFRVPQALTDEVACPANCATATVAAALRSAGGAADKVVLVQGAGMLGLTACAMAAHQGASEVVLCDVEDDRLERGASFGATHCANVRGGTDDCDRLIRELTAGRGADLALELSGSAAAMQAGIEMLRTGGRYIWVGAVFPTGTISIQPEDLVRRMIQIHGVHNYAPRDLAAALDFLTATAAKYPLADLVGATFALAEANEAFAEAVAGGHLRVAVTC